MKIVCIGDSITYGYGIGTKHRWTSIAAASTGYEIINRGVNGDTTGGILARLQEALSLKPQIVFIMGGYNDIFYSGTDTGARANIGSAVQQILAKAAFPVVGIPYDIDVNFCPEQWNSLADFNTAYKQVKDYREWLIRYCEVFNVETLDFGSCMKPEYLFDGLHPSEEGHVAMAEAFSGKIRSIADRFNCNIE